MGWKERAVETGLGRSGSGREVLISVLIAGNCILGSLGERPKDQGRH